MSKYRSRSVAWLIALIAATSLSGSRLAAQDAASTPPATPDQEQPEVLNRGPVHEAFAEPVTMQSQSGLIAPQQPPPDIQEVPPAERPQGQQFAGSPGYWSWDADRGSYIWVSACWRAAPPKMSWVPGYWSQTSGGWEWVAGYWASAGAREVVYLPEPPEVEDLDPVSIQPSPDTIWVPPCMYWSSGQYVRRAGYWLTAQSDWIWVPSHYVVTPRGYIFAEGHWDYSLDRRGVLFAPVYFPPAVYRRAGFTFSPGIVVDVGLLRVSLFAYPRYCHYYFGDYYDSAYLSIGIFPWFESRRYHTWYDPVFEHDRWQHHRSEPRWEEHERDEYRRRCDDKDLRPAHTFHEQEARLSRLPEPQRHASQMTQTLEATVTRQKTSIKFEKIDTATQQKISRQASAVHTFSDDRNRRESPAAGSKMSQPSMDHQRTSQPVDNHKTTVTPSAEHKQTVQPSEDHRTVTPPNAHMRTIQPVDQTKTTVTPSVEPRQTVQPTEVRKTVTPPTVHMRTIQPVEQSKTTVMPAAENSRFAEPDRRAESPATASDSQRERTFTSPRETQVSRPERVQMPASPVVGNSGRQGMFQKGPPTKPADETRNNIGTDDRQTDHGRNQSR